LVGINWLHRVLYHFTHFEVAEGGGDKYLVGIHSYAQVRVRIEILIGIVWVRGEGLWKSKDVCRAFLRVLCSVVWVKIFANPHVRGRPVMESWTEAN
jgi:hypothetical protein